MVTLRPTVGMELPSFQDTERPEPCTIVIFGARGDLARRKLWPALYNLAADGFLPENYAVVGLSRREVDREEFVEFVHEEIAQYSRRQPEQDVWAPFSRHISYFWGDLEQASTFSSLAGVLDGIDRDFGTRGNRVFYFAVPPSATPSLLSFLREAGIIRRPGPGGPWSRVIFEKPFGNDLATAVELNRQVAEILEESQVYRIDHYLAKETVQNILVFRFGNSLFEPAWNRQFIDHVQITAAEEIGVGTRGAFYEEVGALRDVVQNHLLQLLTLVAMEPPVSFEADAIRDEKVKILRAIRSMSPEDALKEAVRGQYRGYREESDVAPDSQTPTFAALRLFIDNWRWQGVPFYIRAGKRLPGQLTEIVIRFRDVPLCLFGNTAVCAKLSPNVLTIRIQPHEGINLSFMIKPPGTSVDVQEAEMKFSYHDEFGYEAPEAYERLILNCLQGDQTLFVRGDGVETQWRVVQPVLEAWSKTPADFPNYEPGSWGPAAADDLLARDRRFWRSR